MAPQPSTDVPSLQLVAAQRILLSHALSGAPVRFGKRLEAARPSEEGAGLWVEARWGVPAAPFNVMFAGFGLLLDKHCSQEADVGFSFVARQGDDLVWNIFDQAPLHLGNACCFHHFPATSWTPAVLSKVSRAVA